MLDCGDRARFADEPYAERKGNHRAKKESSRVLPLACAICSCDLHSSRKSELRCAPGGLSRGVVLGRGLCKSERFTDLEWSQVPE